MTSGIRPEMRLPGVEPQRHRPSERRPRGKGLSAAIVGLARSKGRLTSFDVAAAGITDPKTGGALLSYLTAAGKLRRVSRGVYAPAGTVD